MQYEIMVRGVDGTMRKARDENDIGPGETAYYQPLASAEQEKETLLLRYAAFFGMSVGDFLTAATHALGIEQCPVCQMRNMVLHRIAELGMMRSMFLLMKSLKAQFSEQTAAQIDAELRQVERHKAEG